MLEQIGEQLLYNYPQVYDSYIPDHFNQLNVIANLARVIKGDHVQAMPWFNTNYIQTVAGEIMLSFAKYTDFNDDLYSGGFFLQIFIFQQNLTLMNLIFEKNNLF